MQMSDEGHLMIILEKTKRIKARISEWILSIGLLVWGFSIAGTPGLFSIASYGPMSAVMTHQEWTSLVISIALFRIITLIVDKVKFSLPHLRAVGAIGGLTLWGSLFSISVMYASTRPTGIALYGMLLVFDFLAMWWAAGDAKVADRTE